MSTRTERGTGRRIAFWATLLLVLGAVALAGPSASAATTSSTCGYGTGGQHASTICWLDLSGYNDAIARTAAGQDMSITLPGGGYTMTFNIKTTVMPGLADAVVGPRATPIETRFAFGEDAYTHIPGMPALYSGPHNPGQVGLDIRVSDIVVRDPSGSPLTSYSFVAADAEDNVAGEGGSFTWTSDKAINQIASIDDGATGGCQPSGITGLGTTSVTCAGSGGATVATPSGSSSRAIVVAAAAPSSFDIKWQTFAQSGIALGIQTASVEVTKQVVSRVNPGDSFNVSLTSPQGSTLARGSTGTSNSATTGRVAVVPPADGTPFTIGEAATPGSGADLAAYQHSLQCTRNGQTDSSLPSGSSTSGSVSVGLGDAIVCAFTNEAIPTADTPMIGGPSGLAIAGLILAGGGLVIARWRASKV